MLHETHGSNQRGRQGYVLIATALSLVVIMGGAGLAIDVGRMYVAKNEAQGYADLAAIDATLNLNGTVSGFTNARNAVLNSPNRWNFQRQQFTGTVVEFSDSAEGPWEETPGSAVDVLFARVSATADVPIIFMRMLGSGLTKPVRAVAVGGQLAVSGLDEGSCPFSPFAHNNTGPDYGLNLGGSYTLRWASSPKLNNAISLCPGDATQAMIDLAGAGGGSERGFIEQSSAADIRSTVVFNTQTYFRGIGQPVSMTGGAKQTIRDALHERIGQDTDANSMTYAQYIAGGRGNGRRIMACPVNNGAPGGYLVVQFAAFFLRPPSEYDQSAEKPFCAEYVGAYLQGGDDRGAASSPGFYVARLVQ